MKAPKSDLTIVKNKTAALGIRVIFLFGCWSGSFLWAQEIPAPANPQVRLQLAPGTQCTASISFPRYEQWIAAHPEAADRYSSKRLLQRVLIYTGEDASVTKTFADKSARSEFIRGKHYLALDSKTGVQISRRGSRDAPNIDFRKEHFPELSWVSESCNRGIQQARSRKYLVYEEDADSPTSRRVLYADPETLFPSFFQSFNETYAYVYAPAPSGQKIALPEEIARAWNKIHSEYKRYYKKDLAE